MSRTVISLIPILLAFLLSPGLNAAPSPGQVRGAYGRFVTPLQPAAEERKALTGLGRALFFDRRLSSNRDRSCNDCHDLEKFGSNGATFETLREQGKVKRDVPSVYNLSQLTLFTWSGRETSLNSRVASSLLDSWEMGLPDKQTALDRLRSIGGYARLFQEAYPDMKGGMTFDQIVEALTEFLRGLITPGPFDRFLAGDDTALTEQQLAGAMLFQNHECAACHTGTTLGGQMLQKLGVLTPWPNQADTGYFEVTGQPAHKMFFRVQGLRNVEKTAPYFHDGSVRTLRRAIQQMAIHERGRRLPPDEIILIEAFLGSLTGVLPREYIRPPVLP